MSFNIIPRQSLITRCDEWPVTILIPHAMGVGVVITQTWTLMPRRPVLGQIHAMVKDQAHNLTRNHYNSAPGSSRQDILRYFLINIWTLNTSLDTSGQSARAMGSSPGRSRHYMTTAHHTQLNVSIEVTIRRPCRELVGH